MKYIYLIIFLNLNIGLLGQDFNNYNTPQTINWDDPIYNNLFSNSCIIAQSKSTSIRLITKWYADDANWKTKQYGAIADKCGLFKDKGCYLTCIAMMLTNSGDYINPWDLDQFTFINNSYYDSCSLLETTITQRPTQRLVPNGRGSLDYEKVKITLNTHGFVVAKVNFTDYSGKDWGCYHWILLYDWENVNGTDVFYTSDPNTSDDQTKHDLSKYTPCEFRYFILKGIAQSDFIINNSDPNDMEIMINKGLSITSCRNNGFHKAASLCEKILWTLKNESGAIIDSFSRSDTYILPMLNAGIYYVSLAVNNENGFDATVKKIIVKDPSDPTTRNVISGDEGWETSPDYMGPCHNYYFLEYPGNYWKACAVNQKFKMVTFKLHYSQWYYIDWGDGIKENWSKTGGTKILYEYGCFDSNCCGNYFLTHTYTKEGLYSIRTNHEEGSYTNQSFWGTIHYGDWRGAMIIDCNQTRTSSNLSTALNYDWGYAHLFFSGSFLLTSLDPLFVRRGDYNNKKVILSACNYIELQPGISVNPTSENYMVFEVGEIEGSQGNTTKSAEITEMPEEIPTLIQENESSDQALDIFPNPNKGTFTIKIREDIIHNVQVFNIYGKKINDFYNNCRSNECQIKLNTDVPGIYIVIVKSNTNIFSRKVIIK